LTKVQKIATIPFPAALDPDAAYQELIRTTQEALSDILFKCDPTSLGLSDTKYVRGWERCLRKLFVDAVPTNKSFTSDLVLSLGEYFQQVDRCLDAGSDGPSAFKLLLKLLSEHFDTSDTSDSYSRLQSFGCVDGTPFSQYLRSFKLLVSSISGSERTLAPSSGMIIEIVRTSVCRQFPTLAPLLYPGEMATAVSPFSSVADMWAAFAFLSTNKTPAMAGSLYFSTVSSAHGSSQSRRSSRSSGSSNQTNDRTGTQQNPIVLAVTPQSPEDISFSSDYACWPATDADWGVVYSVTSNFKNLQEDPLLYTALLTQDQRNQAFREHRGKCLNCSSPDHSMKTCPSDFGNSSGLLNPELGNLNDGSAAWRRWQTRIRTYRRNSAGGSNSNSRSKNQGRHSSNRRNRGYSRNNQQTNSGPQPSTALALHPLQQSAAASGAMVAQPHRN